MWYISYCRTFPFDMMTDIYWHNPPARPGYHKSYNWHIIMSSTDIKYWCADWHWRFAQMWNILGKINATFFLNSCQSLRHNGNIKSTRFFFTESSVTCRHILIWCDHMCYPVSNKSEIRIQRLSMCGESESNVFNTWININTQKWWGPGLQHRYYERDKNVQLNL